MYTCQGKIAFITGALGVIGKEYTKHLLKKNLKGIALVDIQKPDVAYQQELETTFGKNKSIFIQADVGNKTLLKDAFETTVKHFGQLDIVINNAGLVKESDYELTLNINFMAVLHGTMMAIREYLPKYKKGPGVIVNTSSIVGVNPSIPIPSYSLSKHAVAAIGVCYAKHPDCLEQDIRVLTICPGPTISNLFTRKYHNHLVNNTSPNEAFSAAESADYLGKGLIKILNEGNNGSVWIFKEGKEPCMVSYQANQDMAMEYLIN